MAEISQFLGANTSLLYNWIVPWKYYFSAVVYCKEDQVFRITVEKESTGCISLALCVFMHQFSESCLLWSPATEKDNSLENAQRRIKRIIRGIQAAHDSFCTITFWEVIVFTMEIVRRWFDGALQNQWQNEGRLNTHPLLNTDKT